MLLIGKIIYFCLPIFFEKGSIPFDLWWRQNNKIFELWKIPSVMMLYVPMH